MERRKFTREYKLEAVRLIKDRGVSYVRASQDLGVHTSQLRDWVKKFADDPEVRCDMAFTPVCVMGLPRLPCPFGNPPEPTMSVRPRVIIPHRLHG
jgi:transposase-like protein